MPVARGEKVSERVGLDGAFANPCTGTYHLCLSEERGGLEHQKLCLRKEFSVRGEAWCWSFEVRRKAITFGEEWDEAVQAKRAGGPLPS